MICFECVHCVVNILFIDFLGKIVKSSFIHGLRVLCFLVHSIYIGHICKWGKRTSLDILAKEISDQTENGLQNMKELNRMHNLKYTLVILYKGLWGFF